MGLTTESPARAPLLSLAGLHSAVTPGTSNLEACQAVCLHVKIHPPGLPQYSSLADEETDAQTPLSNLPKVTQHVRNWG